MRVTQVPLVTALQLPAPSVRSTAIVAEVLTEAHGRARLSQVVVEVLRSKPQARRRDRSSPFYFPAPIGLPGRLA